MIVMGNDNKQKVLERAKKKINCLIPEPITFHEYNEGLYLGKNIEGLLFGDYKEYSRRYGHPLNVGRPPIVEAMM